LVPPVIESRLYPVAVIQTVMASAGRARSRALTLIIR